MNVQHDKFEAMNFGQVNGKNVLLLVINNDNALMMKGEGAQNAEIR